MRPVTLFTAQFGDIPLESFAAKAQQWGFDGLELGGHLDIRRASEVGKSKSGLGLKSEL